MVKSQQLELLAPADIHALLLKRSLVYVPLGTIEWHGQHLPVGFDGLSAHALCLLAAERTGGLVMPPWFFGTGGGHGAFPWTIMLSEDEMRPLLRRTITRLQVFGVRQIVLYSGHFPEEQTQLILDAARQFSNDTCQVLALSPALAAEALPIQGDHAGRFETALMLGTVKEHVFLERLADVSQVPDSLTARMNPTHPLYGVGGPDPRQMPAHLPDEVRRALLNWMIEKIQAA